jgi:hypothetical protein
MPLVKGHVRSGISILGGFFGGFVASATIVFWLVSSLGRAPATRVPEFVRFGVVLGAFAVALMADLVDLRRGSVHSLISWRRQAPQTIARDFGLRRAAVAWGLDAGLGFTTYRVSATFSAIVVVGLCGFAPWWTGAAYALGFFLPLAVTWGGALLFLSDSTPVGAIRFATSRTGRPRLLALGMSLTGFLGFLYLFGSTGFAS